MKSRLSIFLLMSGFISMINSNCVHAQNNSFDKPAMAMLRDFYTSYMTEFSDTSSISTMEHKLNQIKKKYCTASLLKKIPMLADQTDSDPFLKAQDSDSAWAKTLSINKDLKKPNVFIVSYRAGNNAKFIIHLLVVKQEDSYRIADIW